MNVESAERLSRVGSRERSLVRQAVVGVVMAELLCMVVIAAVSIVHERRTRLHSIDVVLEGRADSIFGAVQDAEDAGDNVELDPREMQIPRDDLFAVYDQSGRRLGGSPGPARPAWGSVGERQGRLSNQQWAGHTYRVLTRPNLRIIDREETRGIGRERPITILYAMPLDHLWREIFEGIGFFLGASLLLTLGTTVFIVALMRRILEPLEELATTASAVSPRDLLFHAPEHALTTRELRPLALALTNMLEQLRAAFQKQHQFLGDAAHELKTAVAVVRSSLQLLLLRQRSPEEYQEGLEAAVKDNARAEELIARMLLMARLEEATPHSDSVHVDLRCVVKTVNKRLAPLAAHAGVHLRMNDISVPSTLLASTPTCTDEESTSGSLDVPVAAADLEILVSNLLVNAIEHSSPASYVTTLTGREGDQAVFHVVDQGEGIPEEAQQQIFERFYRVDRSRARASGGAGLGLSITKAIVDAAGGSIAITSRLGEGTTITVRLPCTSPKQQTEHALPPSGIDLRTGAS